MGRNGGCNTGVPGCAGEGVVVEGKTNPLDGLYHGSPDGFCHGSLFEFIKTRCVQFMSEHVTEQLRKLTESTVSKHMHSS